MKNRQTIMNKSITNHKTIIETSMKHLQKISKHRQKWLRKLQMAGMMHTCVGFVGGPSGLGGSINRLYSFFRRMFKILWSKAAAADPAADLAKGSGLSLLEVSNL